MSALYAILGVMLLGAGYMTLGIMTMVTPLRLLPFYRFFLGQKRFARYEQQFRLTSRTRSRVLGAAYILFGLLLVWSTRGYFKL